MLCRAGAVLHLPSRSHASRNASDGQTPPPHTRSVFMPTATAEATACACAVALLRLSSPSSGIQFAPRLNMLAPFTLSLSVSVPEPRRPASAAGSLSSAVTRATVRKPTRRGDVTGGLLSGSNVDSTSYVNCAVGGS